MTRVDWAGVDASLSHRINSSTVAEWLELGIQRGDSRFQRRLFSQQLLAATAVLALVVLSFVARSMLHEPKSDGEPVPQISSITPSEGPSAGGQRVTITGTDLGGVTSVDFGDARTERLLDVSATQVVVITPPHDAGSVGVRMVTSTGSSSDAEAARYTYLAIPPSQVPIITSIEPNSGSTEGGQRVTIHGTHLQGATAVTFGDSSATDVVSISDTAITLTTPAHEAGLVEVRVTATAGTSAAGVEAAEYRYEETPLPAVTRIAPLVGRTQGGETVTISGTGFSGTTSVQFGETGTTDFSVTSDEELTVITPKHDAGVVVVTVSTANGTSSTETQGARFTYVAPPEVTGVDPSAGSTAGGELVTLTGSGFTGAGTVRFDGVPASDVTVISDTEITVTTPPHNSAVVDVTVSARGVTSSPSDEAKYEYYSTVD